MEVTTTGRWIARVDASHFHNRCACGGCRWRRCSAGWRSRYSDINLEGVDALETDRKRIRARGDAVRQSGGYLGSLLIKSRPRQRSTGESDCWSTPVGGESSVNRQDVCCQVGRDMTDAVSHDPGRTSCCKKQVKQANASDENSLWGIFDGLTFHMFFRFHHFFLQDLPARSLENLPQRRKSRLWSGQFDQNRRFLGIASIRQNP